MTKPPAQFDPEELRAFLRDKIEKEPAPPKVASSFETIEALLPEIEGMLKRRFSRQEVVDLLASKGVNITLGTFHTYYTRAKRNRDKAGTEIGRRSGRRTEPKTATGSGQSSEPNSNSPSATPRPPAPSSTPSNSTPNRKPLGGFDNKFDD